MAISNKGNEMIKKTKNQLISKHINSLIVYRCRVDFEMARSNFAEARESMRWYNEAAELLIGMGIKVGKFDMSRFSKE